MLLSISSHRYQVGTVQDSPAAADRHQEDRSSEADIALEALELDIGLEGDIGQ